MFSQGLHHNDKLTRIGLSVKYISQQGKYCNEGIMSDAACVCVCLRTTSTFGILCINPNVV